MVVLAAADDHGFALAFWTNLVAPVLFILAAGPALAALWGPLPALQVRRRLPLAVALLMAASMGAACWLLAAAVKLRRLIEPS